MFNESVDHLVSLCSNIWYKQFNLLHVASLIKLMKAYVFVIGQFLRPLHILNGIVGANPVSGIGRIIWLLPPSIGFG